MAEHPEHPEHPGQPGSPSTGRTPAEPYTVHDDAELGSAEAPDTGAPDGSGRAGPDPVALLAGLAALLVAALALVDALDDVDPRWALAVVAIGVGATILLATLRRRRA